MVIPNPTFAMGIDPGLSGGALCLICPAMNLVKFVDLKAKNLPDSWKILSDAAFSFWFDYSNLLEKPEINIQVAIEDARASYGKAQSGKGDQLKNVGMIYGAIRHIFTTGEREDNHIKLVSSSKWKEYMGLICHQESGESDSAYRRRKKAVSKDKAVDSLCQAGLREKADLLEIKRHDFAEAYLLALYALRSDFIENG